MAEISTKYTPTTWYTARLPLPWCEALDGYVAPESMKNIEKGLHRAYSAGKVVFPPKEKIFRAFELTPPHRVKVILLGQDPYHQKGQANGLAFSVNAGVKFPPSLRNIFKELEASTGQKPPVSGDLSLWAKQGVLLLNTFLTVEEGNPGSHSKIGWQDLTDGVIKYLSDTKEGLVFVFWGNFARSKAVLVDKSRHTVLESSHPSPLSAHRGFFGNGHFPTIVEKIKEAP